MIISNRLSSSLKRARKGRKEEKERKEKMEERAAENHAERVIVYTG